ncbi:DUF1127 domain-containing protein [Poseidonocella sedimentorum]|uniref:DUF1127 domain-containing protein n=1 Tax=Poseidonocella sedimentorum TaxID=871652 RepID=A0A1I6CN30_9RHOB|nr:DUF1127 domain-containing protein [Poseidonocella sedimentorum]SFQ94568.1 protein of unknown function [Poseidonocella sedimentorum]
MATIAQKSTSPVTSLVMGVQRCAAAVGNFLVLIGEANRNVREVQALEAMTDSELAKLGMTREEIPHRVLGTSYYI